MKLKSALFEVLTVLFIAASSGISAVSNSSNNSVGESWYYSSQVEMEEFLYAVGVTEGARLSTASRSTLNFVSQVLLIKEKLKNLFIRRNRK